MIMSSEFSEICMNEITGVTVIAGTYVIILEQYNAYYIVFICMLVHSCLEYISFM